MIITAVWIMLKPGMIFAGLRPLLEKIPYTFIRKPLFECIICMTSIWGTAAWFFFWKMPLSTDLILYLLITVGIMTVISYYIGE
jgi:hypothetical protein